MERRVVIGSVRIIVIVVVTFGRMIFGGDGPADGLLTGGSGAEYQGQRVVYGTMDGAYAEIEDLNSFCSGRRTVIDFVDGVRSRAASPTDQAELDAWVIDGTDGARKGASLIMSSYVGAGHSDQSDDLYELFAGLGPSAGPPTVALFDDPPGRLRSSKPATRRAVDTSGPTSGRR